MKLSERVSYHNNEYTIIVSCYPLGPINPHPCSELRGVIGEEEVGEEAARKEDQLGGGGPDADVVGELHQEDDGKRHAVQQAEPLGVGGVVEVVDTRLLGHNSKYLSLTLALNELSTHGPHGIGLS